MSSTPTESVRTASSWLLVLYGLSGFASLAYEVLWSRMLSMQFGVSIFGVVLTVAAFMVGLGLGSLAGVRWNSKNPLRLFAIFEIGIACYALILPSALHFAGAWMDSYSSHFTLTLWYLLQGAGALCLLVAPAFFMGAGFALVVKLIENTKVSLGRLYGLNTIGGAAGALFPLWALPVLGWTNSIRIIALLGLLVGVTALILSKSGAEAKASSPVRPSMSSLLIYAGIGAGSIMLEVGWVRLYGMIMLRTEYVLGIILAVFLLGIALGSLLLPRVKRLAVMLPFVVGGGVLAGIYFLPAASAWVEAGHYGSFFGAMAAQATMLVLFTLPVTLALGAWLPLLAERHKDKGASGVWLYGANCLGGALGAIAACLVFIPLLGSAGIVLASGLVIAAFGLSMVKSARLWIAYAFMVVLAWPLRNMPPVHLLLPEAEANSQDMSLYEDAISLTHVVRHKDGQRVLLSDLQRMDASSDPAAVDIQMDQARLALLLHPAPRSVLFLGLGTGISMAGSASFPNLDRTAVELSEGAIRAASDEFAPVNGGITGHARITRDDARHFLNAANGHYDVIVGDLFHPDLAGMGSLLSLQQFARAKAHLSGEGVFVQWIALNQFDIESLKVVFSTFRRIFPNAQLFMDGMHLALVGPAGDFSGARAMKQNLSAMSERDAATGGEGIWSWAGRYWGGVPDAGGAVQDEWLPYIEYKLPRARYDGDVNLAATLSWLLQHRAGADDAQRSMRVEQSESAEFRRAYMGVELNVRAWIAAIRGDASAAGRLTWLAYQTNPRDRWIANALADNMMQSLPQAREHGLKTDAALQRVLQVYPAHVNALRSLWHFAQSEGDMALAERCRLNILALSPLDAEASVARH